MPLAALSIDAVFEQPGNRWAGKLDRLPHAKIADGDFILESGLDWTRFRSHSWCRIYHVLRSNFGNIPPVLHRLSITSGILKFIDQDVGDVFAVDSNDGEKGKL